MKKRIPTGLPAALVLSALVAAPLAAQEEEAPAQDERQQMAEMSPEMAEAMAAYEEAGTPGAEHEALARTAGEWTATIRYWMEPGGEPTVMEGTSVIEPVMDGRFVRETVEGTFMGGPYRGVSVMGFNNVTGEVESTWIDNHSTTIYTYTGSINEAGDEITLHSEFEDPATGETVQSRGVRTIQGDTMTDTAWETRNGQERKVMEITYERKN